MHTGQLDPEWAVLHTQSDQREKVGIGVVHRQVDKQSRSIFIQPAVVSQVFDLLQAVYLAAFKI